jgi:tripartite-type tricarboxylate transporter receptor subunit TctC
VLPFVPTTAELGMPQLESSGLFGLLAPLKTPDKAVQLLSRGSIDALRDKATRERATREGVDLNGSAPEGLRTQIESEMSKWARLIKDADIKRE